MMNLTIPGWAELDLRYLVLDVNGTLAVDGVLIDGVSERLAKLRESLDIYLITADTHGQQTAIDAQLGLTARRMEPHNERHQKYLLVHELGEKHVVAIGNGENDTWMLESAAIGIAVLGAEGLSGSSLHAANIVTLSILDALDLLISPKRLVATLRR